MICNMKNRVANLWQLIIFYQSQAMPQIQSKIISAALIIFSSVVLFSIVPDSFNSKISQHEFTLWKIKFRSTASQWSQSESFYRSIIFSKNFDIIKAHNENPEHTYKMAVNQFTVLTQNQFQSTYLNPQMKAQTIQLDDVETERSLVANPTININWVQAGMVSPVQNQGSCGGCYTFSATGLLQSFYRINNVSQTVQLSQQQLLDCSTSYGNNGCGGGLAIQALRYVLANGITTQQMYPYQMISGNCQFNGGSFRISSINTTYGCTGLLSVLQSTPVSIGVSANNWNWYGSGIFANCIANSNDHAVLLVGATNEYWIVKNSWGPDWGENGYIRLSPGNTCGLCKQVSPYVL